MFHGLAHLLYRSSASFRFRWIEWYASSADLAVFVKLVREWVAIVLYCEEVASNCLWWTLRSWRNYVACRIEFWCGWWQSLNNLMEQACKKDTWSRSRLYVTQGARLRLSIRWAMAAWSGNLECIWETKRSALSQCSQAPKGYQRWQSPQRSFRKEPSYTVTCFVSGSWTGGGHGSHMAPWSHWRRSQCGELRTMESWRRLTWFANNLLRRRV